MRWPVGVFLVPLFALACGQGSGSSSGKDAGPPQDTVTLTLPDGLVPVGCPPNAANDKGIGATCTKTGNECTGGLQCSCKDWFGYPMPASMPCFCTTVTFGSSCVSSCGSDNAACCTYTVSTITVSACFPGACLTNGQCPPNPFQ